MGDRRRVIALVAAILAIQAIFARPSIAAPGESLAAAQLLFYSAQYEAAADAALALHASGTDLRAAELHSTAILFQIRRAIGMAKDKEKALKQCTRCPDLLTAFGRTTAEGVAEARTRLKRDPNDDEALYILGKLDLNHVWLYLGTLGRRTGWSEYWEARHSLDELLARTPDHTRARVARAWIDYIVDTQVRWGMKWVLGGGDKNRGLAIVKEAAAQATDPYVAAEARFALWDMQVREKNLPNAIETARALLVEFPENHELRKFIADNAKQ